MSRYRYSLRKKLNWSVELDWIIEKELEYCASCKKDKKGSFLIITVGDVYIAICERCAMKHPKNGEYRNINDNGWREWK